MGYLDDCAQQWKTLMELDPSPALCLRLRKQFGFELFARMLEEPQLTEPVTEFLKRARQEVDRLRSDPAYIQALVEDLQRTRSERQAATYELKQVGERAVPPLFAALAGAADERERINVKMALEFLAKQAVAPLVGALAVEKGEVRQEVAFILGKAGDQRALASLAALVEDAEQPPAVHTAARWAVQNILQGAEPRSAAEYFVELGALYYYQAPEVQPGYSGDQVPLWRWDADGQAIVAVEVSRRDFYSEGCKTCCYDGLAIAPEDTRLGELLVSIYFVEKQAKGGDADPELAARIELLLSSGGKPALLASLRRQLQDDRADLALDVIQVLRPVLAGEGLSGAEASVAGNALLEALDFPDQLLNVYAAETVAEAAPVEPFECHERVVPYLTWGLLWGAEVKTALVASTDPQVLNAFKGHLRALGYKVHEGTGVDEAAEASRGLPTPSLVVADLELMGGLRSLLVEDFRTRFVPKVAVGAADSELETPRGQPEISVPANIAEAELGKAVADLLSSAGLYSRLTAERGAVARMAAASLAKLSRGATVLNVTPASGALLLAMGSEDEEVRLPVLEALGNTRDAQALRPLLDMGGDGGLDEETRLAALRAAKVVLGAMDEADTEVYDALVALLDDESEAVRQAGGACLSAGPFSAEQIVAVLVEKKVQLTQPGE
jgi:HEAT repeat protein